MAFDSDIVDVNETTKALYDKQKKDLSDLGIDMSDPMLASVRDGWPPSTSGVITPEKYRVDLEAGIAPEAETPVNTAYDSLVQFLGKANNYNMRNVFASSAAPAEADLSLDETLDPLATLLTPTENS